MSALWRNQAGQEILGLRLFHHRERNQRRAQVHGQTQWLRLWSRRAASALTRLRLTRKSRARSRGSNLAPSSPAGVT